MCPFNAAAEVLDFADFYTPADKLGTRRGDVLHNQVQASDAAGFSRVHIQPGPKPTEQPGALWCQLDTRTPSLGCTSTSFLKPSLSA